MRKLQNVQHKFKMLLKQITFRGFYLLPIYIYIYIKKIM